MTREQLQLLELTRSSLWGRDVNLSLFECGVDWITVLRLAHEQTLIGLVSAAIDKLPESMRPERLVQLKLHKLVTRNRQFQKHQIDVISQLVDLLRRAGVDRPVLLKGLGVGLNYLDPSLRQCGDIDIYVGERHYERVWSFVEKELSITIENRYSDHHFDFRYLNVEVEIHKYVIAKSAVAIRGKEFIEWCRAMLEGDDLRRETIEGVEIYLPAHSFNFVYIFYHTWRHFLMGGIGLRQFCDWCCYIDRHFDERDREQFSAIVSHYRLDVPMAIFTTIAVDYLGLDMTKVPEICSVKQKVVDEVMNKVWAGGNFGFYRKERVVERQTLLRRKFNTFRVIVDHFRLMLTIDAWYAICFYGAMIYRKTRAALIQSKKLNKQL